METIRRAQTLAATQIAEIQTNAKIRREFTSFFVTRASEIYQNDMRIELREELNQILKSKDADPTVVYRGLLMQINGAFELFVRNFVSSILESKEKQTLKYSDLTEEIRNAHAVYSSQILVRLNDSQINGISYDFQKLQKNLGSCLSDAADFELNRDAFTLNLGNPTPERLGKLFKLLGLNDAFDDDVGKNSLVKKWAKGARPREAAKLAKAELKSQLAKRNDIAHGSGTLSVVLEDIDAAVEFFNALISAFVEKAAQAVEQAA